MLTIQSFFTGQCCTTQKKSRYVDNDSNKRIIKSVKDSKMIFLVEHEYQVEHYEDNITFHIWLYASLIDN